MRERVSVTVSFVVHLDAESLITYRVQNNNNNNKKHSYGLKYSPTSMCDHLS